MSHVGLAMKILSDLEVYKTDSAEGNAKLERLDDKLHELETQKRECLDAIAAAERKITLNKTSTRAEVFRLKGKQFRYFLIPTYNLPSRRT